MDKEGYDNDDNNNGNGEFTFYYIYDNDSDNNGDVENSQIHFLRHLRRRQRIITHKKIHHRCNKNNDHFKKKDNDNHYTRLEEMKTTTTIITTTTMIDEIKEVNDDGKVFCVSVTIRYTTTIVQHLLLTYIVNRNVRHAPPLSLILAELFPLTSFCIVFLRYSPRFIDRDGLV